MGIINREKIRFGFFVILMSIFIFSCKTKYSKLVYSDTKAKVYLNGPYLKYKLTDDGYVSQKFADGFTTQRNITTHADPSSLRLYSKREGKYKDNKQEGLWVTQSFWSNDSPKGWHICREEYFKKGLQHGPFRIYNGGIIIYHTEFKNGTGIEKDFHPNGQLYYEIAKKDGYFTDTLKIYDDLGRLSEKLYFEKDSLVFYQKIPYWRQPYK